MIIEFQGCSLEIGHIGTREEIDLQIAVNQAFQNASEVGRALRDALGQVAEAAAEAGRWLAEFLKTDEGKRLVELCGVGNK